MLVLTDLELCDKARELSNTGSTTLIIYEKLGNII